MRNQHRSRRINNVKSPNPLTRHLAFETLENRQMLSVSLALNGPQTIVPGTTINVSNNINQSQSEMSLVINPTNPLNVVGFSHRLGSPITLDVYSSSDGGLTWSTNEINNTDDALGSIGNRFDPALQFDANGVLYLAYGYRGQATAPLRNTILVVAKSTDGGLNFGNYVQVDSQADILTPSTTDTDIPGLDKWYVTTGLDPISGNQAVYLAYVAFVTEGSGMSAGTDAHISIIGSRDGGNNWTPRLVINDDSALGSFDSSSYASPIVDSFGRLAVSWIDTDENSVMFDRDTDGLWSNAQTFSNDITVRTGVDVNRSTELPPSQPTRGVNAAPMLEVWRGANVLYIPVVEKFNGSNTDLDIWVGKSIDFGSTWTFTRIDDSTGTEFNPWLQVDQRSGTVNVLYYTTDGDVATGNDDVRPRLAMSNDAGATWTRTFLSTQQSNESLGTVAAGNYGGDYLEYIGLGVRDGTAQGLWASRYPSLNAPNDLDAFTANAAFVSSIGDNRLFIGESAGIDDSFLVQLSPVNPAFLEVFVDGIREFTGLVATLDKIIFNPGAGINTFIIGALTGISSLTINGTNNTDVYDIISLGLNAPLSIVLGGGNDIVTLGSSPFASQFIQSPVNIFGEAGDDTLFLGSNNADSILANVTFNGGTSVGVLGDRIIFNDTAPNYEIDYDIASTVITRDGFNLPQTVSYAAVEGIVINAGSGSDTVTVGNAIPATVTAYGNDGNDNFIVGGGNLTSIPGTFNGGNGNDTITFDDHFDFAPKIWEIGNNQVGFGSVHPLVPLDTTGFESVAILAGINGDTFGFSGTISQSLYVDGNFGSDTFTIGSNSRAQFFAPVTILGGVGDESFTWQNASNNWYFGLFGTITYPISLDGGAGFNSLSINESTRTTAASYQLYADRFYANDPAAFPLGADFNYDNMGAIGITLNNLANNVAVYGVSSDIAVGQQVTLLLNGGNDGVSMYPRDSGGNLTINGNFGIGGGSGTDTFTIQNAASTLPIAYKFQNLFGSGTTNISGLGTGGFGAGNDFESIVINAGLGDDTFEIEKYLGSIPLTINAGDGNDTFEITPVSKNLSANLSAGNNIFAYNGGLGFDTLRIYNDNNNLRNSYIVNGTSLNISSFFDSPTFAFFLQHSDVDQTYVTGGPKSDVFGVYSTLADTFYSFEGGPGAVNDSFGLGYPLGAQSITSVIRGGVRFDGSGGGSDDVTIYDTADTTGRTFHIANNSLGQAPGDDLFGQGGYLEFVGITGAMSINLGAGSDTVYARPNAQSPITIRGANPTTAPGDKLNLDLSTAANYVVNGTPLSGNVTSDNLMTLTYTGFETGPILASAEFDGDGIIDGRDFLVWQRGFGIPNAQKADGDANNDMFVDGADLGVWQAQFGLAPPLIASESLELSVECGSSLPLLNSELVDLALAMEWIRKATVEDGFQAVERSTSEEALIDSAFAADDLMSTANVAEKMDLVFIDSNDTEEIPVAWLTEELLEQVFG
ncbi:sialidase family protein [Bythopirellula polymerisocia]|uniref:Uncharacterized protein n=1 Tax=Bythopirellula polymerisocia TaxID=2528003 RepID=A0A5C6CMQ6_9BACT|nr:sialidase family protein [Bythopirellula polymerisocia]TWU24621.1 hypothetical protein Pla144_35060 [Bythopirellula polymerisocia]